MREKIAGVIFGTAIGDALGYPVEFMSAEMIKDRFGGPGIQDYVRMVIEGQKYDLEETRQYEDERNGNMVYESVYERQGQRWGMTSMNPKPDGLIRMHAEYSDDTQMMIATFRGLLRARTWDELDRAAVEVGEEYIAWSKSPENNRAPGNACMHGCGNLARGVRWDKSGADDAKGCGAAMRAMAYGVWFPEDPAKAAMWAAQHARMTHNSRNAMASAAAVAAAVATAIQGKSPPHIYMAAVEASRLYDDECTKMLCSVAQEWADKSAEEVLHRFRGWRGDEAVAASLWCFMKHPDDYREAVLTAVNSPGDSDSLGAITGALVGARVGYSYLPRMWRERIEKADHLDVLAGQVDKQILERMAYGYHVPQEASPSEVDTSTGVQ